MKNIVVIRKVEDLEKIREAKNCDKLSVYLLNDISFDEGHFLLPIDLENTDVIFYGLGNTINNLTINNVMSKCSGLFSNVKSLCVKKLKVTDASVIGEEVCGTLAGYVKEDFAADELELHSVVDSEAMSGGVVGIAKNINIKDSLICTNISGKGVIGGIAGSADACEVNNSIVNVSLKPKTSFVSSKLLFDTYVGYLGSREKLRVFALTEDVFEYLEERDSYKLTL